jgi:hypothetical protein
MPQNLIEISRSLYSKNIGATGLSIFFKCTSTSLFTEGTFYLNLSNFQGYLIQHPLKSGQEVPKTILGT